MSKAFVTRITGDEARMILACIEEYRCTLTPDFDFYQQENSLLEKIEQKLADIQSREARSAIQVCRGIDLYEGGNS